MGIIKQTEINGTKDIPEIALHNYNQKIFDRQQSNSPGKEKPFQQVVYLSNGIKNRGQNKYSPLHTSGTKTDLRWIKNLNMESTITKHLKEIRREL